MKYVLKNDAEFKTGRSKELPVLNSTAIIGMESVRKCISKKADLKF